MLGMVRMAALAAVCAALAWSGGAQAQTPPPVEAFGGLPVISDVAISPDGTKLVIARFENELSGVIVYDLDRRENVYATTMVEDQQLRGVGWADDQRFTFELSITVRPGEVLPPGVRFRGAVRRVDYWRTGAINLVSRNREPQFFTVGDEAWAAGSAPVEAPIEGDPGFGRIMGLTSAYTPSRLAVYRVNLDTGRTQGIPNNEGGGDTRYFLLDHHGQIAARGDMEEHSNRWRIYTYDNGTPRLLMEDVSETGRPVNVEGLLPDGRLVINDWGESEQYRELIAVDRASGAREVLYRRENGSVGGAIRDPWSRQVVGVYLGGDTGELHYFEPALQTVAETVHQRFSGDASIRSWSRDRRRFLIYGERGLDGGGYYIFEPANNRWTVVGMRYPALGRSLAGAERQAITYRARDNVRIPAYLTLPPGLEQPRNAPAVVLVHGGPHSRDDFSFDWWATFLASRGYVVLQPQFRGSTGYGRVWEEAGRGQWGGLMQTDVEDGVAALVRNGMVDPARVCIVGASYGGYAALAGATLTPDRYTCAVGVAGVYDLTRMLQQSRMMYGSDSSTMDWWELSIGDLRDDRARIESVSPINLTDRVHIPVLLIHGTDDTVVPIQQTRAMNDRLRDAGRNVRFVELAGDDHYLSDAPTRISMLREIETFLAQNLGPRPAQ